MRTFSSWLPMCLLGILLLSACSTARHTRRFYAKTLKKEIEKSPVFAQSFTGFTLLDPETGRLLCDVNGGHNFTPASNTKILTLATCLGLLGDSVPALRYYPVPESGIDPVWYLGWLVSGTGDPTFLHPEFQAWQAPWQLLQKNGVLGLLHNRREKDRLGPGWSWDDYSDAYSPELAEMPLYGNMTRLVKTPSGWEVFPSFFQPFLKQRDDYDLTDGKAIFRQEHGDTISLPYYSESNFTPGFTEDIPIWQANAKTVRLLLDTLHYPDTLLPAMAQGYPTKDWHTLYSTPLDTVLRRMMYQSDNFIAEQMLLVCAGVKYDTLRQDKIIQWAKDSLLMTNNQSTNQLVNQSTNPPRWVDGSGLSRYNLVSPRYLTEVLWKLWREQPHDRLLALFPRPGAPETTLAWWQPTPSTPWLFAKTGSMSGVVCMSGYLRTRSGKTLIFSFMNNNFVGSVRPWRLEMRRILELVAGR